MRCPIGSEGGLKDPRGCIGSRKGEGDCKQTALVMGVAAGCFAKSTGTSRVRGLCGTIGSDMGHWVLGTCCLVGSGAGAERVCAAGKQQGLGICVYNHCARRDALVPLCRGRLGLRMAATFTFWVHQKTVNANGRGPTTAGASSSAGYAGGVSLARP